MVADDRRLVHTPFVPWGYWSPCAPLVWDPDKAPDIRFSSSHFRKQHPRHKKALSTTSLAIVVCTENVQLSLNAKDYYNINYSNQSLSEFGIVNGDIIYINSLEKLDDIKQSLENELATPILKFINNDLSNNQHYTSILFMAIPLYLFAIEKGLYNLDHLSQYYQEISSIIRLTFNYPQIDSIKLIFTLFQNGNMTCIAASVRDLPIRKQLILQTKLYLIKQDAIHQSTTNKLNLLYRHLRLLSIRIKDELIEPILLAIHSAGDQQLDHTPFVPLGYWSPCEPLVWNQGFPTPLGGKSVSTNPVKAPDIRFTSSPFRKHYPHHENTCEILCYLPLTSLGSLMLCNRELYYRIRNCNTVWRIQLAKLNAKNRPILDSVLSRQQSLSSSSSLQQIDQKHTTLHKSQQKNIDQTEQSEAYKQFLARYKSLSTQKRFICLLRFEPTSPLNFSSFHGSVQLKYLQLIEVQKRCTE
ncbi:unnamed protein product [Schistosoma margrebowiei]|uniref:Uncharacterized protein n=1 Tax=Schistosoma margrebowiei TaxID=48269 RepID=A0A183MEB6_9TREM|nr:unnamed protein product [Schistosoma margrebowiei]